MIYDFLLVAALREESKGRFETLKRPVIYTGVGKLNAAISLFSNLHFLLTEKTKIPKVVLNLGTAVSATKEIGKVFQVNRFIQRDMRCEPIAPKYITPFEFDAFPFLDIQKFSNRFENVTCGTGDSFLSNFNSIQNAFSADYDIADMEGYALAKVCKRLGIPFLSLKYISDLGDAEQWKESLEKASIALSVSASLLIKDLKKLC